MDRFKMIRAEFLSIFTLLISLYIISVTVEVDSLPNAGLSKATKVQLNTTKTTQVNKTQILRIISIKRHKTGSGSGRDHSDEDRGHGMTIELGGESDEHKRHKGSQESESKESEESKEHRKKHSGSKQSKDPKSSEESKEHRKRKGSKSSEEASKENKKRKGKSSEESSDEPVTPRRRSHMPEHGTGPSETPEDSDEKESGENSSEEPEGHPNCLKHDVVKFSSHQEEYVRGLLEEVTYIPMGSTNFYNALTIMIKGEAMGVIDIGKLCVSRVWNLEKHELNIFGLQRLAVMKCSTNPSSSHAIHCKGKGEPPVSMQLAVTKTDGESYALIVGCLSNGDKIWYVVSEQTSIRDETRKEIHEKLKKLGFHRDTSLEPSYEECHNLNSDKDENAENSQESIGQDSNGLCFNVSLTDAEYSFIEELKKEKAYIPFGSRDYYNTVSLLLTGSDFEQNKVEKACIYRTKMAKEAHSLFVFTVNGYHSKALIECERVTVNHFQGYHCKNRGFHPFKLNVSPVYTDGKKFVLMAGCVAGGRHVWYVVSRLNHVNSGQKHDIHKRLSNLGFSTKGVELNYIHCDDKKSPKLASSESNSESGEDSEEGSQSTEKRTHHDTHKGDKGEDPAQHTCFKTSSSLTDLDMKFLKTLSLQDAYMPMASPIYYDILSQVLTGVSLEEHDIDKACIHRSWNTDFTEVKIQGFGNKVSLDCEVLSSGTTPRYLCKTSGTPSSSMQLIPVFTDHERFLVVVGCRSRSEKFWVVISNENHIDNYARHAIHMEIASLGFTTEAIELNYHHCEKKVDEKESSGEKDVAKHCLNPTSTLSPEDIQFVKGTLSREHVFFPLGNSVFYNAMTLLLTGKTFEEIDADKACMGRAWNEALTKLTIDGFRSKEKTLTCSHDETGPNVLCHLAGQSNFSAQFTPVFTDNLHFVLVAGCLQDGQKFWFVGSRENHVDNFARQAVHIKIASLGFPKDEVALSYHHCEGDNDHKGEGKLTLADIEADSPVDVPEAEKNDKGACPDLAHAKTTFNSVERKFLKYVQTQEVFIPMGSPEYYDAFSHLLVGKSLEEVNVDKACFTRKMKLKTHVATLTGFGRHTKLKCKLVRFGQNHGVHCVSKVNSEFDARVTPVLTDGEKFVLIIGCFSDGQKFWAVASLVDHVDSFSKHAIATMLGNLGFQPNELIELSYKHCGLVTADDDHDEAEAEVPSKVASAEKLPPTVEAPPEEVKPHVDEGKCIDPEQTVDNSKRDEILKILGEGVFTPMANKQNYYGLATMLRGKTLSGDEELSTICPMSVWTDKTEAIFGFDHDKAAMDCDTLIIGAIKCTPNLAKMDNRQIAVYTAKYSIVWSDKENILSVNCLSNGKKNWILLSKKSYVKLEIKELVLKKIVELGFDADLTFTLPYDDCDNAGSSEQSDKPHKASGGHASPAAGDETCTPPEHHLDNDKRDYLLRILGEGVYTPMADSENFNGLSQLLRGQPLEPDELKDVCVLGVWTDKSTAIFGFGTHKAALDCDTTNIGVITCKPNLAKMDNRKVDVYTATYSAVWSDAESVLFVNCLSNGKKSWILVSTQKTVKKETKASALEKIVKLGFDANKATELSYDDCDN